MEESVEHKLVDNHGSESTLQALEVSQRIHESIDKQVIGEKDLDASKTDDYGMLKSSHLTPRQ